VENEYGRFGEPTDPKVLAGLLDEGLAAMTLLWSGEPVNFRCQYLTIDDAIMRPTPMQRPRVPIWVGGHWPHKAPARRAARWDGAVLTTGAWDQPPEPGVIAAMHAYIRTHRRDAGLDDQPFELIVGGSSPANAATAHDILGPSPMPAPPGGTNASPSTHLDASTRSEPASNTDHPNRADTDTRPAPRPYRPPRRCNQGVGLPRCASNST
jgi:hypothetical protein